MVTRSVHFLHVSWQVHTLQHQRCIPTADRGVGTFVASVFFFFFFFLREKVTGARNSVLGKHLWAVSGGSTTGGAPSVTSQLKCFLICHKELLYPACCYPKVPMLGSAQTPSRELPHPGLLCCARQHQGST